MKRLTDYFNEINQVAKVVSSNSGRTIFSIEISILLDFILYGASPANYLKFDFEHIDRDKKKSFVTNRMSRRMIKRYNNPEYIDIFENKSKFASVFQDFFHRKWIDIDRCTKYGYESFKNEMCGGGYSFDR